jgi:lipid II:glycine glycyltransferase (peptidoglycan interpeptide bridge formation enzyme)
MTAHFASPSQISHWNDLILANPDGGNVFQGKDFAEQKAAAGWTPRFAVVDRVAVTILEKSVLGLGKLWYLPKGPGATSVRELENLLEDLQALAAKHDVFAIKIEPELMKSDETLVDLMKLGLVKVTPIQPNFSTVLLDISADLDTVMSSLNQKGRHAIRRAERDGVTVKQVTSSDENCQLMFRLLADTAAGSFGIRGYSYYKTFWQRYATAKKGQLFFAYVDGEVVAGAYALVFGAKSTYKDGASARERSVYGASHLLQWRVIEWAKANGSQLHDFCGAPPSRDINNPEHPHYGIGRFKTSFNKEVTDYVGAYDMIIKPASYKIWARVGERIVQRLHYRKHRENWY